MSYSRDSYCRGLNWKVVIGAYYVLQGAQTVDDDRMIVVKKECGGGTIKGRYCISKKKKKKLGMYQ